VVEEKSYMICLMMPRVTFTPESGDVVEASLDAN
jgi:hypothetical protein